METINNIERVLIENGIKYKMHFHDNIPTVKEAQEKVDFDIEKCFKTIAFKYGSKYVFASLKAKDSIDYAKLCDFLKVNRKYLKKADSEELETKYGYEPGGIGPISVSSDIAVIFDEKIRDEKIVFCGSGRQNATIEIDSKDLIKLGNAVVPISKARIEERDNGGDYDRTDR